MLGTVLREVSYIRHDTRKNDFFVQKFREALLNAINMEFNRNNITEITWNLARSSGPHLSFIIFQKLHVLTDQLLPHELYTYRLSELYKIVSMKDNVITTDQNSPH